jgi:hypothetical protein
MTTMKKDLSPRQMINVELAARAENKKSSKLLKHHTPVKEQKGLKIMFNCECSDPDCTSRIPLTITEYEKLHSNYARFIIVKEHLEPVVETIHKSTENLAIVEKFAL